MMLFILCLCVCAAFFRLLHCDVVSAEPCTLLPSNSSRHNMQQPNVVSSHSYGTKPSSPHFKQRRHEKRGKCCSIALLVQLLISKQ